MPSTVRIGSSLPMNQGPTHDYAHRQADQQKHNKNVEMSHMGKQTKNPAAMLQWHLDVTFLRSLRRSCSLRRVHSLSERSLNPNALGAFLQRTYLTLRCLRTAPLRRYLKFPLSRGLVLPVYSWV
ncbi:hypothetical protein NDU88_011041 [Pleurodeles waltl]|uniref:Uncharacterized protein n=1 Tax=Pleurodeles waltl TaxID=8319 RepID=A0AAV7Q1Y6_PLEWA|nr:hypothetical protein NDU88_011041 [Pleurodeles waltl]